MLLSEGELSHDELAQIMSILEADNESDLINKLKELRQELIDAKYGSDKIRKERILEKLDYRFFHGPCKGICPKCRKRSYYVFYPQNSLELKSALKIFIKKHEPTYNPIKLVAEDLGIVPEVLCLFCYEEKYLNKKE